MYFLLVARSEVIECDLSNINKTSTLSPLKSRSAIQKVLAPSGRNIVVRYFREVDIVWTIEEILRWRDWLFNSGAYVTSVGIVRSDDNIIVVIVFLFVEVVMDKDLFFRGDEFFCWIWTFTFSTVVTYWPRCPYSWWD